MVNIYGKLVRWSLIIILFGSLSFNVYAAKVTKAKCASVSSKITKVHSQLRAGYSGKKGEKLRDKERKLKNLRDQCKKRRYPTSK